MTGLEAQLELSLDFGNVSYLRVVDKRLTIARMGRKLARCGHFQRFNNRLQPLAATDPHRFTAPILANNQSERLVELNDHGICRAEGTDPADGQLVNLRHTLRGRPGANS